MITIVGSIIVLGCVIGSFVMEGGSVLLLWHPSEIITIVGAAFGAFVISNPIKVVKASFANALGFVVLGLLYLGILVVAASTGARARRPIP